MLEGIAGLLPCWLDVWTEERGEDYQHQLSSALIITKPALRFPPSKAEGITQSVVDKADIIIFSRLIKIRVGPFLVSKLAPTTTTTTTSTTVVFL